MGRSLRLAVALLVACALVSPARADQVTDAEARRLYEEGKAAFARRQYEPAYDRFRRAYLLSQRPALLFNMSRALDELDRPGEAAESLRAYLRTVPDDRDRPEIEQRIRTLDEKQRMLDADRAHQRSADSTRRRRLAIGLGVGGAVLVLGGVALGLALGLQPQPGPTPTPLGTFPVTP